MKIEYVSGGQELLDSIEPLWDKLNKHHKANSKYFKEKFDKLTFDIRKKKFIVAENINIRIDIVKDVENNSVIGYCVSTISKDLTGEIDSLYVEADYRKLHIGDKLMRRALEWLDSNNIKIKIIAVAEGNENAFTFYEKYGFYTRRTILEQK